MNSPCVNCGADSRVCKECDWYNGAWMSKDQYEARFKDDMVAILNKIRDDITVIAINGLVDEHTMFVRSAEQVKRMVLDIIDKYRGETE